jgi:hypothetical protein
MKFIAILFLMSSGCASFSGASASKEYSLLDVEHLVVGKDTRAELLKKLGEPTKVLYFDGKRITSEGGQEVWIYHQLLNTESVQRVSLNVDRKTGVLVSAMWIPFGVDRDNFSNLSSVLAHFEHTKFKVEKPKPMGDGHYYSSDTLYFSQETGISFTVNEHNHSVTNIAIGLPESRRIPATR